MTSLPLQQRTGRLQGWATRLRDWYVRDAQVVYAVAEARWETSPPPPTDPIIRESGGFAVTSREGGLTRSAGRKPSSPWPRACPAGHLVPGGLHGIAIIDRVGAPGFAAKTAYDSALQRGDDAMVLLLQGPEPASPQDGEMLTGVPAR